MFLQTVEELSAGPLVPPARRSDVSLSSVILTHEHALVLVIRFIITDQSLNHLIRVCVCVCVLRRADLLTYWDYKRAAQSYQQTWEQLNTQAFPLWPRSDRSLLLFHWALIGRPGPSPRHCCFRGVRMTWRVLSFFNTFILLDSFSNMYMYFSQILCKYFQYIWTMTVQHGWNKRSR